MLNAIKYNLGNLTNFQGRDARQTFWYYILFLVVLQFALGLILSIPMYVTMFGAIFDATANGGDPEIAMQGMVVEMVEQVKTQMLVSIVTSVVIGVMVIASFVRRLHDVGYAGWIVVIPLATQLFSVIYTYTFMDRMGELMLESMTASMNPQAGEAVNPFAMQAEMGWMSLVGWIGYIVVIAFGVLKSQDGPNQYGDEPVRF